MRISLPPEPTDADLADYLTKHLDAFRQDQQLSFRHVYLNPEKTGEQLDAVANELLADSNPQIPKADISTLGDPTLLDPAFAMNPSVASRQPLAAPLLKARDIAGWPSGAARCLRIRHPSRLC